MVKKSKIFVDLRNFLKTKIGKIMSEGDNIVWYHGVKYINLSSACLSLSINYRLVAGLMATGTLTESEALNFLLELK